MPRDEVGTVVSSGLLRRSLFHVGRFPIMLSRPFSCCSGQPHSLVSTCRCQFNDRGCKPEDVVQVAQWRLYVGGLRASRVPTPRSCTPAYSCLPRAERKRISKAPMASFSDRAPCDRSRIPARPHTPAIHTAPGRQGCSWRCPGSTAARPRPGRSRSVAASGNGHDRPCGRGG